VQPWDIAAVAAAFIVVIWFAWFVTRGDPEREEEDAAREYFDRHGRWPDEE
jgi:hypothetical protein